MTGMRIQMSFTPNSPEQGQDPAVPAPGLDRGLYYISTHVPQGRVPISSASLSEHKKDIPPNGVGLFPRKMASSLEDFWKL